MRNRLYTTSVDPLQVDINFRRVGREICRKAGTPYVSMIVYRLASGNVRNGTTTRGQNKDMETPDLAAAPAAPVSYHFMIFCCPLVQKAKSL